MFSRLPNNIKNIFNINIFLINKNTQKYSKEKNILLFVLDMVINWNLYIKTYTLVNFLYIHQNFIFY